MNTNSSRKAFDTNFPWDSIIWFVSYSVAAIAGVALFKYSGFLWLKISGLIACAASLALMVIQFEIWKIAICVLITISCVGTQIPKPHDVLEDNYAYVCCIVRNNSEDILSFDLMPKQITGRIYRFENVIPGENAFLLKLKEGVYYIDGIDLVSSFDPVYITVKEGIINYIGEIEINRFDKEYFFPQIPIKLYSYQTFNTFQLKIDTLNTFLRGFLDKYKLENATIATGRRLYPH